jgi:multiple sugar transport system permease protein
MVPTNSAARPTYRPQRQISDRAIQWLFIAPTLILLVMLNIFPLFYSLYLSFTDYSAIAKESPLWVGFANFASILNDRQLWKYFATTGRFAFFSVGLQTLLGFGLAMLLRERFRASGIITTLILVPMMLSPVVVGLFWKLIFNPSFGILNYLLGYTNPATSPDWLANISTALWAVVIVDVWMWSPFVMLLCLSGLNAIPDYLYEAAAIDRASPWFQFWRITLPQVGLDRRRTRRRHRVDRCQPLSHGLPGPVADRQSQRAGLYHPRRHHRY